MRAGLVAVAALSVGLLSACSADAPPPGQSTRTPLPTSPSTTRGTAPTTGSSSARDVQLDGVIGFPGRTCVLFQASDGQQYALTGPAVTPSIRTKARGGQQLRTSLREQPTTSGAQQTRVRVVGRIEPRALSTCNKPVLVTSAVTILSDKT